MTSIASELSRIIKIEYLDSMSSGDLAHWLIHSFTPERYRAGDKDVIKYACEKLYHSMSSTLIAAEFYDKLWAMHGVAPEKADFMHKNVIQLRRA